MPALVPYSGTSAAPLLHELTFRTVPRGPLTWLTSRLEPRTAPTSSSTTRTTAAGQPVVLIHGYPLDGSSWEKQTTALLDAGYRVITYDRRGFGQSSQPTEGYDYDTFAADLNTVLDHPGPERRRAGRLLDGHRRGGPLPRHLRLGPGRQGRVPRLAGALPPADRRQPRRRPAVACSTASMRGRHRRPLRLLHRVLQELLQHRRRTSAPRLSEEVAARQLERRRRAAPTASAAAQPTWLTDFRADIPKIDVPALIVHGTADNILPIDVTGRRFAKALPERRVRRDRRRPARPAVDPRRRGQRGAAGVPGEVGYGRGPAAGRRWTPPRLRGVDMSAGPSEAPDRRAR